MKWKKAVFGLMCLVIMSGLAAPAAAQDFGVRAGVSIDPDGNHRIGSSTDHPSPLRHLQHEWREASSAAPPDDACVS